MRMMPGEQTLKAKLSIAEAQLAELRDTVEKLAADKAQALQASGTERATRISTEVDSFIGTVGARMGLELRTSFESLYRDAKLGVVSLRRVKGDAAADAPEDKRFETVTYPISAEASQALTAKLEAIAKAIPREK